MTYSLFARQREIYQKARKFNLKEVNKIKSFYDLTVEANNLPILSVLESIGWQYEGSGILKNGVSPFRADGRKTSFNCSTKSNTCTDWSLGIVAGPVKLYQRYYNLSPEEAVLKLAKNFNLGGHTGKSTLSQADRATLMTKLPPPPELDYELLNGVYNLFLDLIQLQDDDRNYLLGRGLSAEEIKAEKYRSCPRRTMVFLRNFEEAVKKSFGTIDVLYEVPGFFKVVDQPFSFKYCSGIFIPCRSADGKIQALQVRNRDESSQLRYFWFSSSNCSISDTKTKYERDGLGCGTPVHFECGPKGSKNLFVTEGYFKAKALKKKYGFSVISVQGVGNWKGILSILPEQTNRMIVAYDSDMCYNPSVARHAMQLGEAIIKKIPKVDYMIWDCDKGKGIDDYLSNGNSDVSILAFEKFQGLTKKFWSMTKKLRNSEQSSTAGNELSLEEKLAIKTETRGIFEGLLEEVR